MSFSHRIQTNIAPVILAAGKGTRMGSDSPKALVSFRGLPLLAHVLRAVRSALPDAEPTIVVGFQADAVQDALGREYRYARQDEQRGTGHAVACALPSIDPSAEHVLVLYTDHPLIFNSTIRTIAEGHVASSAALTMATTTLSDFMSWRRPFERFGRIIRGDGGGIEAVREWKDASQKERAILEVSPSYFCFRRSFLDTALPRLTSANAAGEYYLTDLVSMALDEEGGISSVPISPIEALGMNSPEELSAAESLLAAVAESGEPL